MIALMITVIASAYFTVVKAQNDAASIEAANSSINQAYKNVLAAEKAGGDVTKLLTKLNNAGELLAEAENAYKSGNLANAVSNAENARILADQVNSDAVNLRNDSVAIFKTSFISSAIFSIVGAVVLSVVLLFVWRSFKSSFIKKFHSMKPEEMNTPNNN
jgi:hypothetical protein